MNVCRVKRIIALFMAALLMILSVGLVACNDNAENIESTDTENNETSDVVSTDTDAPEEKEAGITIFENGNMTCDIVIADKAASVVSDAANDLRGAIKSKLGATANIRKEGTFKTLNGGTIDIPKIVVGTLSGDEYCKTLVSGFENDGDHIITVKNGSLYIIGKTNAATAVAVNKFIGFYVNGGADTLSFEAGEVMDIPANYDGLKIAGEPIINYSIVYYDSAYAKQCADNIRTMIETATGITLPIIEDSAAERDYEILVGKTNREEAKALRGAYSRPNVYYDIKTVGKKLIVMAEGYRTLQKVEAAFKTCMLGNPTDMTGEIAKGDILADVDAVDCMTGALEKADSIDARVLHWNMAAPLSWDQSETAWGANWPFTADTLGRRQRAEQQADVVLIYNPDIVTTNEVYNYHAGGVQYQTFAKELSEYFTVVDSKYDTRDDDIPYNVPSEPESSGAENPEKIFIRKDKFTVVDSGWRYLSDGTTFHGIHWAILKTVPDGKQFIASVAHYGDARKEVTYGSEHLSAISFAQKCSGSNTVLPVILTGDMYTYINHSASSCGATYYFLEEKGYNDSQLKTAYNCNDEKGNKHGTFHDPMNDSSKGRASEDFVWYNNKFTSAKFGVITVPESTNTSDHWPVFSDLKFEN